MSEHRCPENIVRMFNDPTTIAEGRQRAIDWLAAQPIAKGDTVFMPHPSTGHMLSFTKDDLIQ